MRCGGQLGGSSSDDQSASTCCSDLFKSGSPASSSITASLPGLGELDIEKGVVPSQHVVLSVQGLTCAACEQKLVQSLSSIVPVQKIQISLALSRAEFRLQRGNISVTDVIRHVERTTTFTCEEINSQGDVLDVLVDEPALLLNGSYPAGVLELSVLDRQTLRIVYDTTVVGARELLEKGFSVPLQLGPPRPSSALAEGHQYIKRTALLTLLSICLTIPVVVLAWAPLRPDHVRYGTVSLVLATIVQVYIAGPFYPNAFKNLFVNRVIVMDLLIVLSTSTAYVYSVVAYAYQMLGRPLATKDFFETSTLLVTLIMFGDLVSAYARQKAIESISVQSLQSSTAMLVRPDGPDQEIDARLLQHGDIFKVVPDCRIATDGTVLSGCSEVDESMVTGESRLVEKGIGSPVIAGSMNQSGVLTVRLSHLPGDNTISRIATMVDEAKSKKPRVQKVADRVAGWVVPSILTLAIITFSIWVAIGIQVRKKESSAASVEALTYAIAVLIVCCPCAIALAVPMVIVIAGGVAAKHGVIFKSAEIIETARKVDHVVLDKTGTLTNGNLMVVGKDYLVWSADVTASAVLGLTDGIKHPVASAISSHLKMLHTKPAKVENVTSVVGQGLEGLYSGVSIRCGNPRWLGVEDHPIVQSYVSKGLTVFCVSDPNDLLAVIGLQDTLREEAFAVVSELKRRGIQISILSGDEDDAVQGVAADLGIPKENVRSRCTPASKQTYIKNLVASRTAKNKSPTVLFCGDGTNDAIALATATVGLHIPSSTSSSGSHSSQHTLSQSAASAVLLSPELTGILTLIDLSGAAFRRIIFNFCWAFVYNTFAILLTAGAFVHVRVEPRWAGLGELVSVLPVVAVGWGLTMWKGGKGVRNGACDSAGKARSGK
ncbi:MAG: hypothetical protein M1817_000476 [Caeruleum heppii]|nr:MAG: hypothetical protein M1817_000476 [Caeruleum heppii]